MVVAKNPCVLVLVACLTMGLGCCQPGPPFLVDRQGKELEYPVNAAAMALLNASPDDRAVLTKKLVAALEDTTACYSRLVAARALIHCYHLEQDGVIPMPRDVAVALARHCIWVDVMLPRRADEVGELAFQPALWLEWEVMPLTWQEGSRLFELKRVEVLCDGQPIFDRQYDEGSRPLLAKGPAYQHKETFERPASLKLGTHKWRVRMEVVVDSGRSAHSVVVSRSSVAYDIPENVDPLFPWRN